jgi:hypothetical protein
MMSKNAEFVDVLGLMHAKVAVIGWNQICVVNV